MKHLSYILTLFLLVSCGSGAEKVTASSGGDAPASETSLLGKLPDIYGRGYDEAVEIQKEIQAAYNAGGSPDRSLMKRMADLPAEVKTSAESAPGIIGTEIPLDGVSPYDFITFEKAVVSDVKFRNNSASVYISFQPAAGSDISMIPRGSMVYYLCLTADNTLLFKNAMAFPSNGVTAISLSMNPAGKSSPARWGGFAKIKFVSKTDFYAL